MARAGAVAKRLPKIETAEMKCRRDVTTPGAAVGETLIPRELRLRITQTPLATSPNSTISAELARARKIRAPCWRAQPLPAGCNGNGIIFHMDKRIVGRG